MRIGIFTGDVGDGDCRWLHRRRRDRSGRKGSPSYWVSQVFSHDALTLLAVIGREVPDIELGTAVVPTYPRHPMVLAASGADDERGVRADGSMLGIGLSHQIVIEGMWGYSFDKPARHMREYLSALMPLLRGEGIAVEGQTLTARGQVTVPGSSPMPVVLAALAPRMLELAGAVADGTLTWCTGPATLESHVIPSINCRGGQGGPRRAPSHRRAPRVRHRRQGRRPRERIAKALAIYPTLALVQGDARQGGRRQPGRHRADRQRGRGA